jgi:hypothetical protein
MYIVTNKLDGVEYADKEFKEYESAKAYADSLIKRYKTAYSPNQYEVLILPPTELDIKLYS